MSDSRGVLREIAWREVFPWLILFRTFRLSLQPVVLGIALLAAVVTPLGWHAGRYLFRIPAPEGNVLGSDLRQLPVSPPLTPGVPTPEGMAAHDLLLSLQAAELSRLPGVGRTHSGDLLDRFAHPTHRFSERSPIPYVFLRLARPILWMYHTETSLRGFSFYLLGTLWTLAVWSFAGGVITRIAAVELGREEPASIRRTFRLALRRWFDLFTAPLYPVLGTFIIALLCIPVGLLLWSSDAGAIVAALLWFFVLLGAIVTALLLLWLLIGWPLMWPAITAEETGDAFEAMSRSYAYSFQRPLEYLFYAAVVAMFGFVCWTVLDFILHLAIQATHWSVSWGAGTPRMVEVLAPLPEAERSLPLRLSTEIIAWTEGFLLALSEAFAYAFFWVSATAIYLLLRQSVDRAEFDEVWDDDEVPRYPLPESSAGPTAAASAPPAGSASSDVAASASETPLAADDPPQPSAPNPAEPDEVIPDEEPPLDPRDGSAEPERPV
jgi:hypothetical protein